MDDLDEDPDGGSVIRFVRAATSGLVKDIKRSLSRLPSPSSKGEGTTRSGPRVSFQDYPKSLKESFMELPSVNSQRKDDEEDFEMLMWAYGLTPEKILEELDGGRSKAEARLLEVGGVRALCLRVTKHKVFSTAFAVLVVLNVAYLAIQAQLQAAQALSETVDDSAPEPVGLVVIDNIFAVAFLIEIIIRIVGCPVRPWREKQLIGDSFMALVTILEVWVLDHLDSSGSTPSFSAVRSLRMLRLLRVGRIARVFRFLRPLRVVAEALGEAFAGTAWIMVIVAFVTYLVAVVITSSIGSLPDIVDPSGETSLTIRVFFGSVGASMLSLNLVLLRGTEWGRHMLWPMLRSGQTQYVLIGIFIVGFNLFASVCLLNLITGMFVSSILDATKRDAALVLRRSLVVGECSVSRLQEIYKGMDSSKDGMVSWEEFQTRLLKHPHVFLNLGLTLKQADAMFRQFDHDKSGEVMLDEFLIGILKHTKTSKSIQMLCIDYQQRKTCREMCRLEDSYSKDVQLTRQSVRALEKQVKRVANKVNELTEELGKHAEVNEALKQMEQPRHVSVKGAAAQDLPSAKILGELERRFGFKTRLEGLERRTAEGIAEVARTRSGGKHPLVWHEILHEEVLPWLQRELQWPVEQLAQPDNGPDPGGAASDGTTSTDELAEPPRADWLLGSSVLGPVRGALRSASAEAVPPAASRPKQSLGASSSLLSPFSLWLPSLGQLSPAAGATEATTSPQSADTAIP